MVLSIKHIVVSTEEYEAIKKQKPRGLGKWTFFLPDHHLSQEWIKGYDRIVLKP